MDTISKPSDIRLVNGAYDNQETWRLWVCRDSGILLAPAGVEALDLPVFSDKVTVTLSIPTNIMIEAGLEQDMFFISLLRNHQYRKLDDIQYSRVTKYLEIIRLGMETASNPAGDDEIRFVTMALMKLCRQWFDQRDALSDNSRQAQIANEFIRLVSQNCHKERGMTFYADRLAIAPKYLSFVISTRTGRTAANWIKEYTMAKAKELLLNTNLSINEISDQLNFIASSDFCKWFRRSNGISPKEFRQQLISGLS